VREFFASVRNNQDVLLALEHRGFASPAVLGTIEGNGDKLAAHPMKGWVFLEAAWFTSDSGTLPQSGGTQTACVCLSSPDSSNQKHSCVQKLDEEYAKELPKPMPILVGPDYDKPWANTLCRIVHT
jgi:hypothetical protein